MDGEKSHGGIRRSRDTEATSSGDTKRRKFDHENVVVQLENRVEVNSMNDVVSVTESGDHVSSSSCFQNDLSLDLKVELRSETETFMSGNGGFSRETSASSEICLDSDEMESSSTLKTKPASPAAAISCRKQPPVAHNPSPAEIDEFFTAIEKKEQKRFADKYNYDIVNDVPMEGRYQWTRLKP
ncbi:hypothetical protein QVD17_26620 [Tagetes erecta]|uniref:Cyclin-dependent kinase inhibitor domain-containing protein n=1 Tax=Tagetes erecta TaxID=13708 RepID=A0AAD8KAF6_TARER|nr:hypothetical protein QVD17_26620 [Tagetes erecta]